MTIYIILLDIDTEHINRPEYIEPWCFRLLPCSQRFDLKISLGRCHLICEGGCSIPDEVVEDRSEQMARKAQQQMDSVDRNYLRESDPRMPVLKPERSSRTNFGK